LKEYKKQRIPEQIATVRMGETMKSERPRKRWRDEIEENLNIMGNKKNSQGMSRDDGS
jgi:hypothetical protein